LRSQLFRFLYKQRHLTRGVVLHSTTNALLLLLHPINPAAAARQLCHQLRWPLIDKDDTRDCLQALPAAALELLDANRLSYDIMFR
jgi:hypothetical protein